MVAWPQSAALLDDALTLALRHLLAAKMVELSFSRDTPRPECDGCWGSAPAAEKLSPAAARPAKVVAMPAQGAAAASSVVSVEL